VTSARVGVVVLTHDRRDGVLATLARLAALPERPPIVVVDNASRDGTADAIVRRCPTVDVVRLARNTGAAGRNVGLLRLRTPYAALCDDDTWWTPGGLARAAALLDAHPRLAIVTARVLVGAEEREDPTCAIMAASPVPPLAPGLPGMPLLGFLAGASVVRREALLAVGGFEPRLFIGGEEKLLAVDLAAAGWAMAYVDDLVVHHHPSAARDAGARRRLLARNAVWFAWLRRPVPSALRATRRVLRERAGRRGCVNALRGLGWVLRDRRVAPPQVEGALRRLDEWEGVDHGP
jgi:GT2 family glycosyltransferase